MADVLIGLVADNVLPGDTLVCSYCESPFRVA